MSPGLSVVRLRLGIRYVAVRAPVLSAGQGWCAERMTRSMNPIRLFKCGVESMRVKLLSALVLILAFPCGALAQAPAASASALKYCYGPFALCTIARCTVPPDKAPIPSPVECSCTVQSGYSVGKACKADPDPRHVISRYSPIRSYQQCPGIIDGKKAVWANCVNFPCVIDPSNPGAAKCECQTATSPAPYIIVSDHPDPAICRGCTLDSRGHYNCPDGVISSATTASGQQITVLVQDAIGDIKVFPPPSK
jgi:hypothetical protein